MPFVLDASSTLPWCFRDEASVYTDRLLQLAYDGERIFVPPHWPAEILNGLLRAVRRRRLSEVEAEMFLTSLLAYDIVVDQNSLDEQWSELMQVAETYALSAYDAAYCRWRCGCGFHWQRRTNVCSWLQRLRVSSSHR